MTKEIYDWKYYVTKNGETPKLGERTPLLYNTAVVKVNLRAHMFYGDLDDNRINILKKDTKSSAHRMAIVLFDERDEPFYLIHNGKVHSIGTSVFFP